MKTPTTGTTVTANESGRHTPVAKGTPASIHAASSETSPQKTSEEFDNGNNEIPGGDTVTSVFKPEGK